MKLSKRHHKNRSHTANRKSRFSLHSLERFFLNYGLVIAGVTLFIAGLLYLVIININNDSFLNLIQSFLKPGHENEITPIYRDFSLKTFLSLSSFTFPGVVSLIFLYSPGFIPLILIYFIPSGKVLLKNSLIIPGFLWLIFVQIKVFLYNAYVNGSFFQDFSSAYNYFVVIQILLIIISVLNKNRLILNLSVIFFFISIVLIRSYFGGILPYCMVLVFLQITIFFLAIKFKWKSPFFLTMLVSLLYLAFYIIRKIIFAGNPQPVSFLLPALAVWFVTSVTGLGIIKPAFGQKSRSTLWDNISYICLFFVLVSSASMVMISGMTDVYPLCCAFVIVILISAAILNERYNYLRNTKTYYYLVCIFSALLLPQLLPEQFFMVLAASLSVSLLFYVYLTHSGINLNLSKVFFFIMIVLYLLEWSLTIVPALISISTTREIYPFHLILVPLLIASISFFYVRFSFYIISIYPFLIKRTILPSNFPEIILPVIISSSCFLILNYVLLTIFPGYQPNLVELAMVVYASVWLIFKLNPSVSGPVIIFRLTVLLITVALYPVIVHPEVSRFLTLFIEGSAIALVPFIMHFFCLGLIILLLLQANGMLRQLYHSISKTRYYRNLMMIIPGIFILLTEYDHLSLLWFSHFSDLPATEILRTNKFIPYSIILLLISIILLIYSNIRYSRFLRRVSLLMILIVLAKILILDLKIISEGTIVILLVSVGLILIGVSLIIKRIRKKRNNSGRTTSSGINTLH